MRVCVWALRRGYYRHSGLVSVQGADASEAYRSNCFELSTVDGSVHCLSMESREDLLRLEKAWHKATYIAVKHLAVSASNCVFSFPNNKPT